MKNVKSLISLLLALLILCNHFQVRHVRETTSHALLPLLIGIAAVPILAITGYDLATERMVRDSDRKAARNTETGILIGAEALELGACDSGKAALLVHGFVGSVNNFNDFPYILADSGWYVRAMRLPGHGTSPMDMMPVSADSLIASVRNEYDALKSRYETVILIGHSMGGTLSALVAAKVDPDAIVLCAPYFGVTHKWYYGLTPETWSNITGSVVHWVPKTDNFIQVNDTAVRDKIVSYRWIPSKGIATLMELGKRASENGLLASVTCPVLLIQSKDDDAADWQDSKNALDRMASADKKLLWLEESNHIIFWDYEKDMVNQRIISFLDERFH